LFLNQKKKLSTIPQHINKSNDNNPTFIDFSSELQQEIQNYDQNKLVQWIRAPQGLVILHIIENKIDPVELINYIFEKSHPKKPTLSPHVNKIYPLQKTCRSTHAEIIKTTKEIIDKHWKNIPLEDKFAIVYKNRGNKHLVRDKLMKEMAECVPNGHKVDLKNPNVVILLQTFREVAGVSIIKESKYSKFGEYLLTV